MSYRRFDTDDIVVSADSITSPAWTNNTVNLTTFYTSSTQTAADSGKYYFNIYNTSDSSQEIQFSLAYGNRVGLGAPEYNSGVDNLTTLGYGVSASYSSTIYGQFRSLISGDEETDFTFTSASISQTPNSVYFISVNRARYKEKILPGSLKLQLKGDVDTITLTDNSKNVATDTFVDGGRVYSIYSGSEGTVYFTDIEYGKLYPDIGIIALNAEALTGSNVLFSGSATQNQFNFSTDNYSTHNHITNLYNSISGSGDGSFILRSEETLSSNFIFVRARNSEFNYSTNPSNITGSGELRHSVMIDNPQSYITAVGLYNDNNDLLAVAKLSTPLLKDFTKEALVRIKLDY